MRSRAQDFLKPVGLAFSLAILSVAVEPVDSCADNRLCACAFDSGTTLR